jgi:hypothetical protein
MLDPYSVKIWIFIGYIFHSLCCWVASHPVKNDGSITKQTCWSSQYAGRLRVGQSQVGDEPSWIEMVEHDDSDQ